MANITPKQIQGLEPYVYVQWLAGADTDVGLGVNTAEWGELTAQAVGDATSVTMQGSNDGGTTWAALGAGVSLAVSAGTSPVTRIAEHPLLMRPKFVGGTNTAVYLSMGRRSS